MVYSKTANTKIKIFVICNNNSVSFSFRKDKSDKVLKNGSSKFF